MKIIKSSGVLFIPLHAEHEYNEGHGDQDKSRIVSLHVMSSTNFRWTPGMDCLVMKYMSVCVCTVSYQKTDTTHSYNFRLPNSFFL